MAGDRKRVEPATCSKCGGNGPFPLRGRICKKCCSAATTQWRLENPERYNALARQGYHRRLADPQKRAAYNIQKQQGKHRRADKAVEEQERLCILCGAPRTGRQWKYCVDCAEKTSAEHKAQREKRSHRKAQHPDWTADDWRLHDERRAIARQEQQKARELQHERVSIRQDRNEERLRKYRRVQQKRRRGIIACHWCEQPIPPASLKAHHKKGKSRKFCNRTCLAEWRRYFGFYRLFSSYGNEAQAQYKAAVGEIPGYAQRAEAVKRTNEKRRKRVSEQPENS